MRAFLVSLLFFVILFWSIALGASLKPESFDSDEEVTGRSENSAINAPLSLNLISKQDAAIVAAPDGTIYFVESSSGNILWSFKSGSSIYSSYQALPRGESDGKNASMEDDNFYIDCGEDWELYRHGNGSEKMNVSAEELLRHTPSVSGDGVMLGSKTTTVFLVDSKTGKVIHSFGSDVFPLDRYQRADESPVLARKDVEEWVASHPTELETVEKPLYIVRTDYTLKYTSLETGRLLWYLMFADFEVIFKHEGTRNLLEGDETDMKLPSYFKARPIVHRIRDRASLESIFTAGKLPNALPGVRMLSLPPADFNPVLEPMNKLLEFHRNNEGKMVLALPTPVTEEFGTIRLPEGDIAQVNISAASYLSLGSHFWTSISIASSLLLLAGSLLHIRRTMLQNQTKLYKPVEDNLRSMAPKRKKVRKSGVSKNSANIERKTTHLHDETVKVMNGFKGALMFSDNQDSLLEGRKIGKLFVSSKEIAKGSNGTIVLEGFHDGRPVAVKRLIRTHHDVAVKEIQNLIASDHHPNIVRWYGMEYDQDFVYLSLERCTCSLYELILSNSGPPQEQMTANGKGPDSSVDCTVRLQHITGNNKDFELWKANGYPSAQLLKVMRDIIRGVGHLHELGIIHRDLKPQNVLVIKERSICAKISDMGISKRLAGDMASLTRHATGGGSSGWQAPEQLRNDRQTRAVDLFSLGCILFFCITGGKHPFGETLERDINIVNDQKDLFLIENIPEAMDLISHLLEANPELRPKAMDALSHPFFWNTETRLSFLRDTSDRVELEDRENGSELLKALESMGKAAFGGQWNEKMDNAVLSDIGRYRRYKFDSLRDLLRVIRNKLNHYRELPKEVQGILGQVPEGFDSYFSNRFPHLLIEVYKVIHRYCAEEETFGRYFKYQE